MTGWRASVITTERLTLGPLTAADAGEMVGVLGDVSLYRFTGGAPPTLAALADRYARLERGSPTAGESWLNWVVRRRTDVAAIGTVQATVVADSRCPPRAHLAWVIGAPWRGHGYAAESATALVSWLHDGGITDCVAHIHPDHVASERVARRAGLHPTPKRVDGEVVWVTGPAGGD
jgi:RimJ/RimL family protein N-acetyltransferase